MNKPAVDALSRRFLRQASVPQTDESAVIRRAIFATALTCVDMTPAGMDQEAALEALAKAGQLFEAALNRRGDAVGLRSTAGGRCGPGSSPGTAAVSTKGRR